MYYVALYEFGWRCSILATSYGFESYASYDLTQLILNIGNHSHCAMVHRFDWSAESHSPTITVRLEFISLALWIIESFTSHELFSINFWSIPTSSWLRTPPISCSWSDAWYWLIVNSCEWLSWYGISDSIITGADSIRTRYYGESTEINLIHLFNRPYREWIYCRYLLFSISTFAQSRTTRWVVILSNIQKSNHIWSNQDEHNILTIVEPYHLTSINTIGHFALSPCCRFLASSSPPCAMLFHTLVLIRSLFSPIFLRISISM